MVQFARPNLDITDGNWIGSDGNNINSYLLIGEGTADDSTYIESEKAPANDPSVFDLSNVVDPVTSTGHIIRYRYQKSFSAGANLDLTVQLRQGYVSEGAQGTLIHSEVHAAIPTGWTAGTFTLSAGEADSITDYTDLQIRFLANQP